MQEFRSGQYLTFRIGRYDFAIYAATVRGVLPVHQLDAAEESPNLAGHAEMDGVRFPVFDLRAILNLRRGLYGRNPSIVVVETAEGLAGFVADSISDLVHARQRDFRNGKLRIGRPRPILHPESLTLTASTL